MSNSSSEGLTFLLPLRDQAPILEIALQAWIQELLKLSRKVQLLLIDDGSTDATKEVLASSTIQKLFEKENISAQILHHESPRGFGASFRTGLAVATEPLLFYTSLDYPYQPSELHEFIRRIEEKDPETGLQLHLVNGYRALTPIPRGRAILGKLKRGLLRATINVPSEPAPGWLGNSQNRYWLWMRMLFGLRLGDINSRFKLFRRSIFDRISIQSEGDFVHAEILAKANFLGCYMDEIAIVKTPGPFTAKSAIPPIAKETWKEMWKVFHNPDFGLWPKPTPPEPIPEIV